jgi:hypothetical protein
MLQHIQQGFPGANDAAIVPLRKPVIDSTPPRERKR